MVRTYSDNPMYLTRNLLRSATPRPNLRHRKSAFGVASAQSPLLLNDNADKAINVASTATIVDMDSDGRTGTAAQLRDIGRIGSVEEEAASPQRQRIQHTAAANDGESSPNGSWQSQQPPHGILPLNGGIEHMERRLFGGIPPPASSIAHSILPLDQVTPELTAAASNYYWQLVLATNRYEQQQQKQSLTNVDANVVDKPIIRPYSRHLADKTTSNNNNNNNGQVEYGNYGKYGTLNTTQLRREFELVNSGNVSTGSESMAKINASTVDQLLRQQERQHRLNYGQALKAQIEQRNAINGRQLDDANGSLVSRVSLILCP